MRYSARMPSGRDAFEARTNPSFTEATGPCLRCGATDKVSKVRGCNMCFDCHRGGVSARYDQASGSEAQTKVRGDLRDKQAKAQKDASQAAMNQRMADAAAKEAERHG